jgi:hypothetical protein
MPVKDLIDFLSTLDSETILYKCYVEQTPGNFQELILPVIDETGDLIFQKGK